MADVDVAQEGQGHGEPGGGSVEHLRTGLQEKLE